MPTYEYACKSCGAHTDVVQAFTDDALTECPTCGGRLRKVFGNIGISFKGSGFYKNDSRSKTPSATSGNGKDKESDSSKPAPEGGSKGDSATPDKAAAASSKSTEGGGGSGTKSSEGGGSNGGSGSSTAPAGGAAKSATPS